MSALSILTLVLPLPVLFVLHEVEEVWVQHRWMQTHRAGLEVQFPRLRPVVEQLSRLSTRAFALAALEEFVVLLAVTCYVLADGPCAMQLWAALFIAFSLHLAVHMVQAVLVRGYVPGLVTSLLLSPFAVYGLWSIWLVMSDWKLLAWGTLGVAFMTINLRFAHWLGIKVCGQ